MLLAAAADEWSYADSSAHIVDRNASDWSDKIMLREKRVELKWTLILCVLRLWWTNWVSDEPLNYFN